MDLQSRTTKADLIARFLVEKKVPAVFELSGGMIVFITDAIQRLGKTKIVGVRHEQSAGFAAEAATRLTGLPAVAMATSGPGATNLITSIASSYFDSVPTIYITGQVNQKELRTNREQRQHGFQELDIVTSVQGITKFSHMVKSSDDLQSILEKSWNIAVSGRPGPVLIDIPIDVQQEYVALGNFFSTSIKSQEQVKVTISELPKIENLLANSKRPLILAGGGIQIAGTRELFRNFVKKTKIPVVTSLMGLDSIETDSEYKVGFIGSYGNRWANRALEECDLLLCLGTRLDVRQVGSNHEEFFKDKILLRVDIDPIEIESVDNATLLVNADLSEFFRQFSDSTLTLDSSEWIDKINTWKLEFPQESEQGILHGINPSEFIAAVTKGIKNIGVLVSDVGQHQMWSAQSAHLYTETRFLTSGGMGAMGFAIPSLIGCAVVSEAKCLAITGDGCAQLSLNELQTIKENNLPVTIIVMNNKQHGMVAQFQEQNTPGRYFFTRENYSTPNFVKISKAYGVKSKRITRKTKLKKIIRLINRYGNRPLVLEVCIPTEAKALPKMNW